MFGLLSALYSFVACGIVEFVFFIVVDTVAKTLLHEAKDEPEKRHIWLFESLVLLCISFFIYALNHTPFLLVSLSVATFSYTQLRGKVDFRYWWNAFLARWDEFQQHTESMEMQEQLQRRVLSNLSHDATNPVVSHPQHVSAGYDMSSMNTPPRPAGAPPWNTGTEKNNVGPSDWFIPGPGFTASDEQIRWRHLMPVHGVRPAAGVSASVSPGIEPAVWLPVNSPAPQFAPFQPVSAGTHPGTAGWQPRMMNLARKPLPGHEARVQAGLGPSSPPSWKSRVMSVLGLNPYKETPPGLVNGGQNLCFMNAVLQCIARSPKLSQGLIVAQSRLQGCTQQEMNFLIAFTEVVYNLALQPGTSEISRMDPVELRRSTSQLNSLLVAPPGKSSQKQQDAAEYLMWLLQMLHRCMKADKPASQGGASSDMMNDHVPLKDCMDESSDSASLRMLRIIYGDLTKDLIDDLKASSRKEIDSASGLDDESHVEAVRRLSDLEWLTYKQQNKSVIDDLFTGQMVECQHCKSCNHVSVSIQPFNILPVSITEGQELSRLAYLEDCFTKFCKVEELCGPDGLRCECSGKPRNSVLLSTPCGKRRPVSVTSPVSVVTPHVVSPHMSNGRLASMHKRRVHTSDSVISSPSHTTASSILSPIRTRPDDFNTLNDSGFQDNQFRTSTPIASPSLVRPPPPVVRLTDGQRRTLLRQLPECLIVQLMRFLYVDGAIRKIHRPVNIPKCDMDLTNLLYDAVINRDEITAAGFNYKYNLYGVCMHLGGENTSYGHYVSYSLAADGHWYKLDDEVVTQVNMDYELTTKLVRENAYLLFYRRSS